MDYTTNYQLPVWAETDRILMDDFNDAFDTIDTAMGGFGNCQVYTTSYVGTGLYGQSHSCSITCPMKPVLAAIFSNSSGVALALNPVGTSGGIGAVASAFPIFQWSENTISWFGASATAHMNIYNVTYHVAVLMAAD